MTEPRYRAAPTLRVVANPGGAIELACGAGSRRAICALESPAIACWLLGAREPADRRALERSAAETLGVDPTAAAAVVGQLIERGALTPTDEGDVDRDDLRLAWSRTALAIHEPTRDLAFESSAEAADNQKRWADAQRAEVAAGRDEPSPPPLVEYAGARVDLFGHRALFDQPLPPLADGPLPFDRLAALPFDRLAALVDLALGATDTFEWAPWGRHIRRTSPSLGARHAVSGFLVARDVADLAPGVWRVDPNGPALVTTDLEPPPGDARAALVLTVRWPRMIWKYRDPRYYAMALFDAGHLVSTARLGARHLGLDATVDLEPGSSLAEALALDELDEGPIAVLSVF